MILKFLLALQDVLIDQIWLSCQCADCFDMLQPALEAAPCKANQTNSVDISWWWSFMNCGCVLLDPFDDSLVLTFYDDDGGEYHLWNNHPHPTPCSTSFLTISLRFGKLWLLPWDVASIHWQAPVSLDWTSFEIYLPSYHTLFFLFGNFPVLQRLSRKQCSVLSVPVKSAAWASQGLVG